MNAHDNDLRPLLDEIIPPAGEQCGPDRGTVIGWAKQARRQRIRARAIVTSAAIVAAMGFVLPPSSKNQPLAVSTPPPSPPPLMIEHINDAQLFSLLEGKPIALMEWPNGERTLLMLDP